MVKKYLSFAVVALIFTLGLVLTLTTTPATPATANADIMNDFLSGPASKVYVVTPASEVLWPPGSGEENILMIY